MFHCSLNDNYEIILHVIEITHLINYNDVDYNNWNPYFPVSFL